MRQAVNASLPRSCNANVRDLTSGGRFDRGRRPDRIECRKQQQAGEETRRHGPPRPRSGSRPIKRQRAQPEQQIEAEPDREEGQRPADCAAPQAAAPPAPGRRRRGRRATCRVARRGSNAKRAAAPMAPEIAGRSADHRRKFAGMGDTDAPARQPRPSAGRTTESATARTGAPPGWRRRAARPR